MRRLKVVMVTAALLLCTIAATGVRDHQWRAFHQALAKALPKTAIAALDPIVKGALKDGAYPEAARAIVQRIALEGAIQGNKPEEKITRLRAEIAQCPPEMRPVLEAILARWYWEYFQENRWRFLQRSATAAPPGDDFTTWDLPRIYAEIDSHFTRALSAGDVLKRTPITAYDALLDRGTAPDTYRPTLYDFIAHEALAFYTSGEQAAARPEAAFDIAADGPIFSPAEAFMGWRIETPDSTSPAFKSVRLYQDLLRFHAADAEPSARIDADLERLNFGKNVAVGPARDSLYRAALERLAGRYPEHELSARVLAAWATSVEETGDLPAAWRIAHRGADRFPESLGGRECHNVIQVIESKSLAITTERVWNDPLPALEIRYRNLSRVYFRLVPFDFEAWALSDRGWPSDMSGQLDSLIKVRPAFEWSAPLPETPDFRERVERLPTPSSVRPGSYYLIASDTPDFTPRSQPIYVATIWVSKLALVVRDGGAGGIEGFVLDAATGSPVAGATVHSWTRSRNQRGALKPVSTDVDGRFRVPGDDARYMLLATHGDQGVGVESGYISHPPAGPRISEQTLFFTDRAIYRPGQAIRYKGICVEMDTEHDRYRVLGGRTLTVVARDRNGSEVGRQPHTTNDYGSFSGSFTAPGDRLLGSVTFTIDDGPPGWAHVSVEEYKRPKFAVSLAAPARPAHLGAEVSLVGTAMAYTGVPVDAAKVTWRVTRQVRFPAWWQWRRWWAPPRGTEAQEIGHGTATTGTDGTFTVPFTARPDPAAGETDEATFSFVIHADVTDPAGETRSADRIVNVGYTALSATLSASDWQAVGTPTEITLHTRSLDGEPLAAVGRLMVYRLRGPERVERAPLADAAPYELLRRSDNGLPGREPEPDPSNPSTWAVERSVFERSVRIDTSGAASVAVPLPAGVYRARLEAHDAFGKPVTAELPLRVVDPLARRCAIKVADMLVAPTWSVEPGGEFLAVWGSGYEDARAFVEVEHRGRLLQSFWTAPGTSQVAIRQRVTAEMRGGFMVRVTMVHENRAYLHEERVDVPWTNQRLAIRWEHFTSKLRPGQRDTWTAVLSGPDATRAVAEMVATCYDASLDAFMPHSWPAGFRGFRTEYAFRRPIFENSAAPLEWIIGAWPQDRRSVDVGYRSFPSEILGDWSVRGGRLWSGMSVSKQFEELRVSAERPVISVTASSTMSAARSVEMVAERAAGGLHFRGGRPDETQFLANAPPAAPSAVDLGHVVARRNLEETAFFYPQLVSDANGEVRIQFTMPQALTEWRFMGFAHDRTLRAGLLEASAVTSLDLMVQPNPPRFLREGDTLEFTVKVTNRSAMRQAGRVRLTLADAATGASADAALSNRAPDLPFVVPPRESRTFAWRLAPPDGMGVLTYTAVASTGRQSDGEEGFLPVLPRSVLVTESLPLPIRGPATREFDFERLRLSGSSSTLRHQSLTVQMVSNPAWYAVMALPYLMEYPYECSEQMFNRLYANALARHIAGSDPKIHRVFEQWRGTPALDSPLEKSQDLKSVLIEETPWLRQAHDESQARRNVGVLFDDNRLDDETARASKRLADLQLADGAWPWFPGGPASDYITLYITTGFGRLRHLGAKVDQTAAVRSLARLDGWSEGIYRDILRSGRKDENHLSSIIALYLYGRSFFLEDRTLASGAKEAADYWLAQARRYWPELRCRQSQAQLALALSRFGDAATARDIVRSLRERAVHSEELGMFWRDEELSWWWYRAPIETQAMMIEAFQEVAKDSTAVEDCRVWLLKQKQTQDWRTTKATADAVYALLLRGGDLLASSTPVEVSLAGHVVRPQSVEAGTGFYEKRYAAGEVTPALATIQVRKLDPGVAWGSIHWQYFEDMSKLTPYASTPLALHKALFIRRQTPRGPVLEPTDGAVHVGDELVVRLELRTDRDMEFVHLKDYRGSGVEPVDVLSGYRYQDGLAYYQETRDTASHFFIDYLPKGAYVFEYSGRVQHRGRYQTGMAEIQCMYAPEFNGHSESLVLDAR